MEISTLVDVKKIQRDIDQDDGGYNYGQHASNFTKDDGRRILTRECLYRCRTLNARSPVRPTIRQWRIVHVAVIAAGAPVRIVK
jgi:hypothetical protein